MKKSKLVFVVLAIVMLLSSLSFFAGCNTGRHRQPGTTTTPDSRFAVFSNGGSAVQFGNYVYFVNGHGGFSDPNANQNIWRQVEKGALYRARLRGNVQNNMISRRFNFWYGHSDLYVFDAQIDNPAPNMTNEQRAQASGMEFYTTRTPKTEWKLDHDGEYVRDDNGYRVEQVIPGQYNHTVDVERVIGKRMGQDNTIIGGGIFILGEWIFFSSPHNLRNHVGVVEYGRTDFFRARLDGSEIYRLYTTVNHLDEHGDVVAPQYAFHKFNGSYYLLVLDGSNIISVEMDRGGNRIRTPQTIAENVVNAYFPVREIYYNGINEHGVENFIYFTRNSNADDILPRGNVLELMRPNGSERMIVYNGGNHAQIMGTDNGIFFYSATVSAGAATATVVYYSNFHNLLMGRGRDENGVVYNLSAHSPSYRARWINGAPFSDVSGYLTNNEFNSMGRLVGIRPNHHNADSIYILGFSGSEVMLFSKANTPVTLMHRGAEFVGYNGHAGFMHRQDGANTQNWNVYSSWTLFLKDGGEFFSVNLFDGSDYRLLGNGFNGGPNSFRLSILPNFAVFFANAPDVSPNATNYAWFVRLNDRYKDPMLVAYIIENERPQEEEPVIDDEDDYDY
ncbi:MAG: hypothetical protein FWE03_03285 [Firmicutes bacterium]|nr:hypothetical protein [Bacillota bacterium]